MIEDLHKNVVNVKVPGALIGNLVTPSKIIPITLFRDYFLSYAFNEADSKGLHVFADWMNTYVDFINRHTDLNLAKIPDKYTLNTQWERLYSVAHNKDNTGINDSYRRADFMSKFKKDGFQIEIQNWINDDEIIRSLEYLTLGIKNIEGTYNQLWLYTLPFGDMDGEIIRSFSLRDNKTLARAPQKGNSNIIWLDLTKILALDEINDDETYKAYKVTKELFGMDNKDITEELQMYLEEKLEKLRKDNEALGVVTYLDDYFNRNLKMIRDQVTQQVTQQYEEKAKQEREQQAVKMLQRNIPLADIIDLTGVPLPWLEQEKQKR